MKKSVAMMLALITALAVILPPLSAEAQSRTPGGLTVPVTLENGALSGTFKIRQFVQFTNPDPTRNTGIGAVGTLVWNDGTGQRVAQVTVPVSSLGVTGGSAGPSIAQVGCEILDLSLGPIDLDLLGLVVHLDEVNLEIVAVPGAGNLLGNLLCAIAGLLDPQPQLPLIGNLLQQVLNLLNQILGILG